MISETDIEAVTPMLRRYSQWIGDTLRRAAPDMSSDSPVCGSRVGTIGAFSASTSRMNRSQLVVYSARACGGMSEAG